MLLLSPGSVAKRLRLSVSRIQQLNREGKLPALRDSGNRRLFELATVEAFEQQREWRASAVPRNRNGMA
jgi:excisionase family DNA binding protein